MKKTPFIILCAYMIAALTGVTFAWMSPPNSPRGTDAVLEYGDGTTNTLGIQSKDISFASYVYDEDADAYVSTNNLGRIFQLIPNTHVKLRFDFTNSTTSIYKVKLQLANITTDSPTTSGTVPDLFKYIYFGINGVEGYNNSYSYKNPVGTFSSLSEVQLLDDSYFLTFISDLNLTPTNPLDEEHSKISLYGYVSMSAQAGPEFLEKNLSLGTFRVVL